MGLKRIIAPENFNRINTCYFEDFVTHGHLPVSLCTEYIKKTDANKTKVVVPMPRAIQKSLSCRGEFYITKTTYQEERSPKLTVKYISGDSWDATINKICSTWGKEAIVKEMVTKNRDTLAIIRWIRAATENGANPPQLVLDSVDDVPWTECHYKTQRAAAGELWVDTCEFMEKERVVYVSTCVTGSHAAA